MFKRPFDKVYYFYDFFMQFWNLYKDTEFISMLDLSGNEIIADIGGGTGYIAKALSRYCGRIYVLDHSLKMLSRIRKKGRISPVCRDALNTGFESEYFDVIILSDFLHHIKDHHQLFIEIDRICRPGGKILVQDFDITFIKTRILKTFERLLFGRLYFQTRIYFDTIMGKHGFIKEKEYLTNFNYIQVWRKQASA